MSNGAAADGPPATSGAGDAPLLPEPSSANVDVGQAIATLMIDSAFAQRKTAREAKQKAESAMIGLQKEEIAQMQKAADEKYTAAKIDAWVQIGTGVVSGVGIGLSLAGPAGSKLAEVGNTFTKFTENGGKDGTKGTFGLWSGAERFAADSSEAAAKEASHGASNMKSAIDDCGDDVRATKELVRKALDFMKEYQSAQSQSQAAALHRA
ncbi:MAG TPA: hypothetical protein VLT33_28960 [Labilithrix sp.]|nr:hypothetical protein [Labilithrix sp.]